MPERTYRRGFDWPRASWPKKAKIGEGHQCGNCGEWFIPRRSDARYCSGACRVAAHRGRKEWEADQQCKLAVLECMLERDRAGRNG